MKLLDFLFEVGDTTLPITWIEYSEAGEAGDFEYKGFKFRILIETAYDQQLNKILPGKKIGFVSFLYQQENNHYTQDTTGLIGELASSVFSIVKNALKDKFEKQYDVMFFASKRKLSPENYQGREQLFNHIFFKLVRETGYPHYSFSSNGGHVFVFSKQDISNQIKAIQDNFNF